MPSLSSLGIFHLAMQIQQTPLPEGTPNLDTKGTLRMCQSQRETLRLIVRFALPFRQRAFAHHLDLLRFHLDGWVGVFWPRHFLPADRTFRDPFAGLNPLLFPCDKSFHEARVAEYMT